MVGGRAKRSEDLASSPLVGGAGAQVDRLVAAGPERVLRLRRGHDPVAVEVDAREAEEAVVGAVPDGVDECRPVLPLAVDERGLARRELGALRLDRGLEALVEAGVDVRVVLLDELEHGLASVGTVPPAEGALVDEDQVVAVGRGDLRHLDDGRAHPRVVVLVVLVLGDDALLGADAVGAEVEGADDEDQDPDEPTGDEDHPGPEDVRGAEVVRGLHGDVFLERERTSCDAFDQW